MPKSPIVRYLLIEAGLFGVSTVGALLLTIPIAYALIGVGLLLLIIAYSDGYARIPYDGLRTGHYPEYDRAAMSDFSDRYHRRNRIPLLPYLAMLGLPLVIAAVILMMM